MWKAKKSFIILWMAGKFYLPFLQSFSHRIHSFYRSSCTPFYMKLYISHVRSPNGAAREVYCRWGLSTNRGGGASYLSYGDFKKRIIFIVNNKHWYILIIKGLIFQLNKGINSPAYYPPSPGPLFPIPSLPHCKTECRISTMCTTVNWDSLK